MADLRETDVAQALALHQQGKLVEAEPLYRAAIAAEPDNADAISLLGTLCHQRGQHAEAVDLLQRAIALKPDQPTWYANLGLALRALERYPEGAEALRHALDLRPDYPEAWSNLGLVQHQMSQFEEAIASFGKAIGLRGNVAGFHVNLGNTYLQVDQHEKAVAAFRSAVAINPKHAGAHSNLGVALLKLGQLQAAEGEMRAAIALRPDFAEAHRGLGMALREQGNMPGALDSYQHAIDLDPASPDGRQQLLFVENYLGRGTPGEALAKARTFAAMLPAGTGAAFRNDRDPQKRLRVGFVSADFRVHPVSQFFAHLLPHFDRNSVEITLYASQSKNDQVSAKMKADADRWTAVRQVKDAEFEALVREDGIDILIDLSGHTGGNRMPLFARRAAPVQATWLGYSGTTGVGAIDYIIADESVIPPGDEVNFSETPLRLPDVYLCYAPPALTGMIVSVSPPPALRNGHVTFGSYNKLDKMSDAAVACWSAVLTAVPDSKLLLKSGPLDNAEARKATERRYAVHGIAADRLVLKGQNLSHLLHFESYSEIDICLDPFPYNGTTTICDALWMGVPTVTLAGDRFISRVGSSLMRTVGLGDLVARDVAGYVAIATRLAHDLPRLESVRTHLRDDLLSSPLGDAPRFVRNFEMALRQMWQRWCAATP